MSVLQLEIAAFMKKSQVSANATLSANMQSFYYGSSEFLHHSEYFSLADSHHSSVVSVLALLSAIIVGLNPQFGAELDGSY